MVEEYGVKLNDFTQDKLQCFFDDFIGQFEVDALYVFINWVLEDIDRRIKEAERVIEEGEKIKEVISGKEGWQELIKRIRDSNQN